MFQRLKDAIDLRIAEEQTRQRPAAPSSPSRSSAARPNLHPPATSLGRRNTRSKAGGTGGKLDGSSGGSGGSSTGKGSDPADFEKDFDDSDGLSSRTATPGPPEIEKETGKDSDADGAAVALAAADDGLKAVGDGGGGEDGGSQASTSSSTVGSSAPPAALHPPPPPPKAAEPLSPEVRAKLRRLEKLEGKFTDLLRSYRVAHARVALIEPFETSLREYTPLTSINDPAALVEYLVHVNLKTDMVMTELKRVTAERDDYKKKVTELEAATRLGDGGFKEESLAGGLAAETATRDGAPGVGDAADARLSAAGSASAPPQEADAQRQEAGATLATVDENESTTRSHDVELPRLRSELQGKDEQLQALGSEAERIRQDLAAARASHTDAVLSLEQAKHELHESRGQQEQQANEWQQERTATAANVRHLEQQLKAAETKRHALEIQQRERGSREEGTREEMDRLSAQLAELQSHIADHQKRIRTLNNLVETLRSQLKRTEDEKLQLDTELAFSVKLLEEASNRLTAAEDQKAKGSTDPSAPNAKKKARNKKKQAAKTGPETSATVDEHEPDANEAAEERPLEASEPSGASPSTPVIAWEEKLQALQRLLAEKDAEIEKLQQKRKMAEDLQEEIDSLRDQLVDVGQNCVESREQGRRLEEEKAALQGQVRRLEEEKAALQGQVQSLGDELSAAQARHSSRGEASEQALHDRTRELETAQATAVQAQTDLAAAHELAAARFKDLATLRDVLQKAQPELAALRSEVAGLRATRDALDAKTAEARRLAGREQELAAEIASLQQRWAERGADLQQLSVKYKHEAESRIAAENALDAAQGARAAAEAETKRVRDGRETTAHETARLQQEAVAQRAQLQQLDADRRRLQQAADRLTEEIGLKTAQHASAQSLMASMRDQTAELGTQMKEARERGDSLEEELAHSQRLLGERSRESETMRRLLAEVETRADGQVRAMRDRLEAVTEERDRVEEDAATLGRRRARELDELKVKVRNAERDLRAADEDRDAWSRAQLEWRRRREELEAQAEQATRDADDVRRAMAELRDALDESERQLRAAERQQLELRRELDAQRAREAERERERERERMAQRRSSSKPSDERRRPSKTTKPTRTGLGIGAPEPPSSPRSSLDSSSPSSRPRRHRLASPPRAPPRSGSLTSVGGSVNGSSTTLGPGPGPAPAADAIDFVYLKNVLLQFLEQRDRRHQMQLIPVLAMLLHFDGKDEQKWMSAITAK
ncbi:MAG: hypothetical protein M1826_004357 [Phylliscum demangeonii]|nr:MAG: hypothetical protein M1826_004357 [Phylliscum demangeonii]